MPAVSILTPVHNRPDDLRVLINSLVNQTFTDFELVIVDDGSVPPVATGIDPSQFQFPIRILRNEHNMGIGYSRNRACEAARGELLVWLDSDSAACEADWLAGHVAVHGAGLPFLGIPAGTPCIVHSRVCEANRSLAGTTFRYCNWHTSCQMHPYRVTRHHVPTNNTSLPRRIVNQVGPFDAQFEVAEDIDWGLRALQHGMAVAYVPDIPVYHRDPETFSEIWRSYRKMGRFAAMVRHKNPGTPNAWLYPRSFFWGVVWALPMTALITLYSSCAWFPTEKRVVLYLPALFYANLANAIGMLDYARHARRQEARAVAEPSAHSTQD